jgi:hypothetical protein
MTGRQARRQRREQQRQAKRTGRLSPVVGADSAEAARKEAIDTPAPSLSLDDEFSPEFIAEARAMRERIERRAAINRANAAHSTGPLSPEGKLASSRNALKHGLASGELIIPGEDPARFESLLSDLLKDHQPATATEELLIREMAQSWWLAQRALRLQNDCFTTNGIDQKRLALFLRYHATHERAFHKALAALTRLQKERRRAGPSGFVSQKAAASGSQTGFVSQIRAHSLSGFDDPPIETCEKEHCKPKAA